MHVLIFGQHTLVGYWLSLGLRRQHERDTWGLCCHVSALLVGKTVVNTCNNNQALSQGMSLWSVPHYDETVLGGKGPLRAAVLRHGRRRDWELRCGPVGIGYMLVWLVHGGLGAEWLERQVGKRFGVCSRDSWRLLMEWCGLISFPHHSMHIAPYMMDCGCPEETSGFQWGGFALVQGGLLVLAGRVCICSGRLGVGRKGTERI